MKTGQVRVTRVMEGSVATYNITSIRMYLCGSYVILIISLFKFLCFFFQITISASYVTHIIKKTLFCHIFHVYVYDAVIK